MAQNPYSYTAYKPSGVPWLGDVPAHWNLVPNRVLNEPEDSTSWETESNPVHST